MIPETCLNCMNYYYSRMPMYPSYPMGNAEYPSSTQPQGPGPSQPQGTPQPQGTAQPQGPTSEFEMAPGAPTTLGKAYTQGYLRSIIVKRVKLFFLIGTNIVQDRDGILTDVGISYVILKEADTNNLVLCDIYSIKFVTIYQ